MGKESKKSLKSRLKIAIFLLIFINSCQLIYKEFDYKKQILNIEEDLDKTNDEFIDLLNRNNIKSITMTSVGNSIATGYNQTDDITPLLYKNNELLDELDDKSIKFNIYSYCRPQNNTDSHILEWISKKYTIQDINKMISFDLAIDSNMDVASISQENVKNYFSLNPIDNPTIDDILDKDTDMNIIVYNGCTGRFLDSISRGHYFSLSLFEEDLRSVDMFCNKIFLEHSNVQIYICGVPNYINANFTKIINNKIKEITNRYPNVIYVESAPCKIISKNEIDIHYNHDEYLILNNNIYESINNYYISSSIAAEIYNCLIELSSEIEYKKDTNKTVNDVITGILDKYPNATYEEKNKALEKVKELVENNYGSYFSFLPKNQILSYKLK